MCYATMYEQWFQETILYVGTKCNKLKSFYYNSNRSSVCHFVLLGLLTVHLC